jgi:hypothetical protein
LINQETVTLPRTLLHGVGLVVTVVVATAAAVMVVVFLAYNSSEITD